MENPLEGVKVIELATYASAPFCGRLLAEMGAEVIKIETPEGASRLPRRTGGSIQRKY